MILGVSIGCCDRRYGSSFRTRCVLERRFATRGQKELEQLLEAAAKWHFQGLVLKLEGTAGAPGELLLTVTATGGDAVEFPELSVATAVRV